MATNKETAQKIVDRMLETINEGGYLPWVKPWNNQRTIQIIDGYTEIKFPVHYWSRAGKPYHGINIDLLAMSGKTGEMVTFNQCKAEGGRIKKGAKSATIIYWNMIRKEDPDNLDADGKPTVKVIPILKTFNVFSVETDCEGLKTKHHPDDEVIRIPRSHWEPAPGLDPTKYDIAAEAIIADYIARAKTLTIDRNSSGDRAYYDRAADHVVVPSIEQFAEVAEYYSTTFHELGHSTGHSSRLDRFSKENRIAAWGDENYSREELVAEITAASILSELGLEAGNSFRNSTAYVKSWSENIKKDPMMFITAASRAEKAIDLILGRTTEPAAC